MTAIEKMLRWIVLAGVFSLPFVCLVVTSSLYFPYITGKNFAFRIIVEIITAAWLALALVNPDFRPRRSSVLGALAFFVLVIGIADLFGAYAFKSIWSNYERMDGWITLIHLLAYTLVTASVVHTQQLWRYLMWTSLGVSAYVSIYGLFQVTGKVALGLGGAAGLTGRIDTTFGNPIYMAVYMLFHAFIAAMLWAEQWVEKGEGRRLPISLAYGSVIVLDTIALLLTGTRGAILGLVGGALVAAFLTLVQASNSRTAWRVSAATVVGLVVLIGGFLAVKDQAWVQKVGFLQRMATISLEDNTTKARFINWSMAWKGVQERPILGWGQENYALVFDKYYDPRMYAQEPWFDRVHNIVFDWLVAGGFLGLFAYLSIFGAALWALWRRNEAGERAFTIAERSILTGLLAGYFVHNFFVFDNVTSYILFGMMLAYIAHKSSTKMNAPALFASRGFQRGALPYVAVICTIVLLITAWYVNQKPLNANRLLLTAISQGNPSTTLASLRESIALGTYGMQEAREQLAQMTAAAAGRSDIPQELKQSFFDLSISEMQKQAEMSPLDARFPLFLGVVYGAYGAHNDAMLAYEKALSLSPHKQTIMFQLAENASVRGDAAEAVAYYKKAYELDTSFKDAAIMYAAALIQYGQPAQGEKLLAPMIETGEAAHVRVLNAYRSTNQLYRAIPIWEASVRARSDDPQQYFTLAALYYLSGDRAKAIAILEEAKRKLPEIASQADPVIEEIRKGTAQVL